MRVKCTPKKREARIRDRIDQILHQELPLGHELVVLTPEGHDLQLRVDPAEARHLVGVEAATIHQVATMDRAPAGLQDQLIGVAPTAMDLGFGLNLSAFLTNDVGIDLRHLLVVDDAGLRDQQPGDADGMWLILTDLLGSQATDAFQTIGLAASFELSQCRQLAGVCGHDEFAAALMGDAMLLTELVHGPATHHAVASLERAGPVI